MTFRDIITKVSKTGIDYTQVSLSDSINYETYESFAVPNVLINAQKGDLVIVDLLCSKNGYNISLPVQAVKTAK